MLLPGFQGYLFIPEKGLKRMLFQHLNEKKKYCKTFFVLPKKPVKFGDISRYHVCSFIIHGKYLKK